MLNLWITLPADKVYIRLPMSLLEKEIRIALLDADTVDATIAQLEELKKTYTKGSTTQ